MRVRPLTPAAVVAALAERITALPSAGQATRVLIDGAPPAAPGTVLLLDGTMLLGLGLAAELVVHLHLSAAALRRGTPTELAWTLPAYARYARRSPRSASPTSWCVRHLAGDLRRTVIGW